MKSSHHKETGFVEREDGKVYFEKIGSGTEVILWVHGLPLNADSWFNQTEYFGSSYTNVVLDLRGYARSSQLPDNIDKVTDLYLNDIIAVAKHLNIESFNLVGFASGGHVTLKLAATHPDLVKSLIVINGSPKFMRGDDWPLGFTKDQLDYFVEKIDSLTDEETAAVLLDPAMGEVSENIPALKEWFASMVPLTTKKTLKGFFTNIAYDDDRDLIKNIKARTLILNGVLGQEVTSEVAFYLRQNISNSQLVEINGIDHFAFATQVDITNKLIEQFLEPKCSINVPEYSK